MGKQICNFSTSCGINCRTLQAYYNAATMIGQSKTIHQAEIDAELIDFLRFNVEYVTQMYENQPDSDSDAWNRVEYRPLEGFVYAVNI